MQRRPILRSPHGDCDVLGRSDADDAGVGAQVQQRLRRRTSVQLEPKWTPLPTHGGGLQAGTTTSPAADAVPPLPPPPSGEGSGAGIPVFDSIIRNCNHTEKGAENQLVVFGGKIILSLHNGLKRTEKSGTEIA